MSDFASFDLRPWLRAVPDFPKPGILFQDITPLLGNPEAFTASIDALETLLRPLQPTALAAIESRGFLFAAPLCERLNAGILALRKPGKLPWKTIKHSYALEYGQATLEVHTDGVGPEDRVVIVDDLLATGGTAAAAATLIRKLGAEVTAAAFVVELTDLQGRAHLPEMEVLSLVQIGDNTD